MRCGSLLGAVLAAWVTVLAAAGPLHAQGTPASAANNTEQTQAIMKDFGRQACGTCHTPFRVPPKQ